LMVLALAGDSTMTSFLPLPGVARAGRRETVALLAEAFFRPEAAGAAFGACDSSDCDRFAI
jgi:hypothetical protein